MQLSKQESSLSRRKDDELRRQIMGITMLNQEGRPQTSRTSPLKIQPPLLSSKKIPNEGSNLDSQRNIKFKVNSLEDKLYEFHEQVRGTREEFRHLFQQTALMKNSLIYQGVYAVKDQLDGKIRTFFKQIKQGKETDQKRYQQIRKQCGVLWNSTEEIKEQTFQLTMRIQALEEKLGFKGAYRLESL